jgi:hypothetical protein
MWNILGRPMKARDLLKSGLELMVIAGLPAPTAPPALY